MIPHHVIDGDGPPVVLLNSLGTTLDMWRPQVTALSAAFLLVRLDFRGHGGTPAAAGALTVGDLARDVVELLDHLAVPSAHIAGASLGGAVAMRIAHDHPGRVERLALVSTAARIGTPESWRERAETVRADGGAGISEAAMGRWFSPAFHADQPGTVAAFRERFDATDAEGYAACCEALSRFDMRGELTEIHCPAVVIAGTGDEVTTVADAAYLDERIPNARMVLAEGAKHLLTVERADWANRILLDFFTTDDSQARA
ncbi:alpha/beta fold hydrolase [Glycomyces harbinensis]|uniref:3-oxoadipate enol-lactonase n=1 Tax=Glycomyces harbinensis TaxID=58114 RepID=A0A1G6W3E4_9ACTN|nr:alpha/beta fold hydrolase [Glycomyces harbinensis]SDD60243.1 3-oxoadipate enol-lactonase [Glycomyces harbinensis]